MDTGTPKRDRWAECEAWADTNRDRYMTKEALVRSAFDAGQASERDLINKLSQTLSLHGAHIEDCARFNCDECGDTFCECGVAVCDCGLDEAVAICEALDGREGKDNEQRSTD